MFEAEEKIIFYSNYNALKRAGIEKEQDLCTLRKRIRRSTGRKEKNVVIVFYIEAVTAKNST